MTSLILCCFLLGVAAAAPQGYNLPTPNNQLQPGGDNAGFTGISGGDSLGGSFRGGSDDSDISGGRGGGFGGISTGYNDNSASRGEGGHFEGDIRFGGNSGNSIGGNFESSFEGNSGASFDVRNEGDFGGAVINGNTGGFTDVSGGLNDGSSGNIGSNGASCSNGQVRHVDGSCVTPMVSRNIFVFAAPKEQEGSTGPVPQLPTPKVEYNIVFVRTPEGTVGAEPIVIPPPQQKTLVYVLSKNQELVGGQRVIEVPAGPSQQPEVYYVNYDEGDNPTLPGGVDLQTALNTAGEIGQLLNGGSSAVGGGHLGGSGRFEGGDLSGTVGSISDTTSGGAIGRAEEYDFSVKAGGEFGASSHTNTGGNLGGASNGFGDGNVNTPSQVYGVV